MFHNIHKNMVKQFFLIVILTVAFFSKAFSQQENQEIRRGNREYKDENFSEAELNYREALESNPQNIKALYNLANSLYKQGRYDEAANILEGLTGMELSDSQRADILHNLGNANIGNQKIEEGIEAYKNSLRLRPEDMDTRHNLAYAMRLLQEQEQQQQEQNQDQEQDENEDKDDQQPQPQDQEQEQDDQQQERQPRPDQISPQDAERILDAMNQQEQKVQEKIEREEKVRQPARPEREW
jgi:tetratricopeptide (TPR) repeat protein